MFFLGCCNVFAQTTSDTLIGTFSDGTIGKWIIRDVYTLPKTAGQYWNGFGLFGNLRDTVRPFFSVTNIGTSGASTYDPATGTFNIPIYSSGSSGSPGGITGSVQFNRGGAFVGNDSLTWTSSGLYVSHKLGIGTSSPGYKLTVTDAAMIDSVRISKGAGGVYRYGNIAIGDNVLDANTTGVTNTGLGDSVMRLNTTGSRNAGLGNGALTNNTTGSDLTAMGNGALIANTTGLNNTGVGRSALNAVTTQNNNTGVGTTAGLNTSGASNTLLGSASNSGSGSNNTLGGAASGHASMSGSGNTGFGQGARIAQNGSNNTGVGYAVLASANNNSGASAFGQSALALLNAGFGAIGIGVNAGTAFGASTTNGMTQGDSSIFIGYYTMAQANTQKNQIAIAGFYGVGLGSNSTAIGNTGTTKAAIAGRTAINGNANTNGVTTLGFASAMSEPIAGAGLDIMGGYGLKLPDITQAERDALSLGAPIATVTIATAGSGQTNGTYALTFTGGGGSGAAGYVTVAGNIVTLVTISSWGNGYTSAPTVTMATAGGTSATFTATVRSIKGLTVFCTDCTATDGSTGVSQTYQGSSWKNWW